MENKIKVFENKHIRAIWNAEENDWYFSVVDVCNILADSASKDPGAYWRKLKQRLKIEGSELVTNCHGLKMLASDGKYRETDTLNTAGVLRLVQVGQRTLLMKQQNVPTNAEICLYRLAERIFT